MLDLALHSMVTVGTKWQVVIPKDVREKLNIKPWDKLMTITKWNIAIGFIKSDKLPQVLEHLNQEMQEQCC